ncbi:hypothetical protein BH23CHL5_BH23CHL5_07040 [soil metagenome]
MPNRPAAAILLAAFAAIATVVNTIVALQFVGVIPWGEDDLDFWGGDWVGAFLFGTMAAVSALLIFGWIQLKPWALSITILAALIGVSNPLMALMAGSKTWSSALPPLIIYTVIGILALQPQVRNSISDAVRFSESS